MKLFHQSDVAIEPVDDRNRLEKAARINIDDDSFIPSSSKGIIKIIGDEAAKKLKVKVGDKVYFDPRMLTPIEELKLVIVDQRSVLMEAK